MMSTPMPMEPKIDNALFRKDFAASADAVLRRLDVDPLKGLTQRQARQRLDRYGPNLLKPPAGRSELQRFLDQFRNVLIYVLLSAAVVTAAFGHYTDAGVISAVVLVNALIGFIQEGRAEKALDAVKGMLSPYALVVREGHRQTLPAPDLVPGDIVHLKAGDRVPADIRLINLKNLQVQEGALTGESEAVEKTVSPVAGDAALGDRASMAYAGTFVTYGQATGVVTATGDLTEIGRISTLLSEVSALSTPLVRQMDAFAWQLTVIILALAAMTFIFGIWVWGFSSEEMFLASVGLAIAAIPEGLPAVMTIALTLGVTRMAGRNAIIRRLPAVETLGSVSVICCDKTGTLTRNELMVQTVAIPGAAYTVTGDGYAPEGILRNDRNEVLAQVDAGLLFAARAAALCNDAELTLSGGRWSLLGSPTDGAFVSLAMKAGLDIEKTRALYPRTDVIPFDSAHKFMASLHRDHEDGGFIFVKGAAERILDMCMNQRTTAGSESGSDEVLAPLERSHWDKKIAAMAGDAQRVLAVAWRSTEPGKTELEFSDVETGLTLLGLFGLLDPPRHEAIEAIAVSRRAGIDVKMITGDHLLTARAIGKRFGLGSGEGRANGEIGALTGTELDQMSPREFAAAANDCDIFARTTPEHKLRLVEALQAKGLIVAMTGDGVNDAPALKRADIGVAMGIKGTEAAKEAAEMVLADDNFATIVDAIEEGRNVYDNLVKTILFVLPTSAGEALTVVAAVLMGQALPITALQILWINMVTMITLGLALAFETSGPDVMSRPPRDPTTPILSRYLTRRVVIVSILIVLVTFGLYNWMIANGASVELARTLAVNGLVAAEIGNLLNCRHVTASALSWRALSDNKVVLGAIATVVLLQLIFTYAPVMNRLFHTSGLALATWLWVVASGLSVFLIIEIEKFIVRNRKVIA